MEANSTGGQGSRRAVVPSDDDDDEISPHLCRIKQRSTFGCDACRLETDVSEGHTASSFRV